MKLTDQDKTWLRSRVKHYGAPSDTFHLHPEIIKECIVRFGCTPREVVEEIGRQALNSRRSEKNGFDTDVKRIPMGTIGTVVSRNALWQAARPYYARGYGRSYITRSYDILMDLVALTGDDMFTVGTMLTRLDKALFYQRHGKKCGLVSYIKNNTIQHTDCLKFGVTANGVDGRYANDKVYGRGVTILEVPGNFEEEWKNRYAKWRIKRKGTIELFSAEILEESDILKRFAHLAISGRDAVDG